MLTKFLLNNLVTDQLKEEERQEGGGEWGERGRDRERKEGMKEKENKDSEIKKTNLGLLQRTSFFYKRTLFSTRLHVPFHKAYSY